MALHPQAELLIAAATEAELPPIETLSPVDARRLYNLRSAELPVSPAVGEVTERTIPGPGGELGIRIYRPVGTGR